MIIKKAELTAVAVKKDQYPDDSIIEIAFAGRSNVGKSSLINTLLNRRNFARVSGSPGKTRTINFYQINDQFRIVDLPGYGYARVSKSQSQGWGNMIEDYLLNRKNLVKVVQLVDIRHSPSVQDVQMYDFLKHYGLDGIIVATKADKVSRNERDKNIRIIKKALNMSNDDLVIPISSLKKSGYEELLEVMEHLIEGE